MLEIWLEAAKSRGEVKMKNYFVLGMVLLILLVSIIQAVQINTIKNTISGGATSSGSSGESYQQMMARMHPDQARQNSPTMVGGC